MKPAVGLIVTREQFEEQGATSVRQAVSYTPGSTATRSGRQTALTTWCCAGFSDGSLDNVYLDGLKMMGDTNSHSSLVVDPWFLDSIEVVRGPASVLYGRSSPGGMWRSPPVSHRSILAGRLSSSPVTITSVGRCST
ncbi:TonB-dependent receptor plug domain-containing protein [Enterobacter hormaechei]